VKVSKFELSTFALALFMGLARGVLSCCIRRIPFIILNPPDISLYIGILSWVSLAVNPFLMFTVFYLHGRKVDLKAKLSGIIVLLFAGLYVGNALGHIVTYPIIALYPSRFPLFFSVIVLGSLFPTTIIYPFFVALSASAIAYIRKANGESVGGVSPPSPR